MSYRRSPNHRLNRALDTFLDCNKRAMYATGRDADRWYDRRNRVADWIDALPAKGDEEYMALMHGWFRTFEATIGKARAKQAAPNCISLVLASTNLNASVEECQWMRGEGYYDENGKFRRF